MQKNRTIYFLINLAFIICALLFVNYNALLNEFHFNPLTTVIVLLLFLLIHLMRFARMYFILLEDLIKPNRFLQLYIKTTFVSTLIPFKIGEIFKMYCYSIETNNTMKGVVAVLIEKFFDALVLCIFMIPYALMNNSLSPLLIILMIFIILALLLYFSFNGTYQYLNRFLVCRGGGNKSLVLLKILEGAKKTYNETKQTLQGRFILLLFLSLAAWGIESLLLTVIDSGNMNLNFNTVFSYISDAFFGITNTLFTYYSCLCAIIFSIILLLIYGKKYFNLLKERKKSYGKARSNL